MRKGQVSVEFMFAFGIILFIFLIILGFTNNRNIEITETTTKLDKDNTCLLISSLLTSAFVSGDGIIMNTSIDYNATINVTDINSSYQGLDVEDSYCFLSVQNVPNIKLIKGVIEIKNQDGDIGIENVQT